MARDIKTTVTFLEMLRPPHRKVHHAPPGPVAILKAEQPPLHFYRYLFDAVGRDHCWIMRKDLDDEALADIVYNDKTDIHLLYFSGWPGGFCESSEIGKGVIEIKYFGLVKECIGQGIGSYFLDQMLHYLWTEDIRRLIVETCTMDHPHALPLYQKYGFSPYGQTERVLTVD